MAERRSETVAATVATIGQLNEIKQQLDTLADQVNTIDTTLADHVILNKSEMIQTHKSFVEVKNQIGEIKSKVDEIEQSLPYARIVAIEEVSKTIQANQDIMLPKVDKIDDIYEIIVIWQGFSKAVGWIVDNVKKLAWILSTMAIIGTGGYYMVEYVKTKFKVVPVAVSYYPIPCQKPFTLT